MWTFYQLDTQEPMPVKFELGYKIFIQENEFEQLACEKWQPFCPDLKDLMPGIFNSIGYASFDVSLGLTISHVQYSQYIAVQYYTKLYLAWQK